MQSSWWRSVVIILFLGYVLASGLPPRWRPFGDIAVFPWGRWTMFVSGNPSHAEIVARGQTAGGAIEDIDIYRLFPAASSWVYEGHPLHWGLRNIILYNRGLRRDFCAWVLERVNAVAENPSAKITALTLSDARWPLPPDITLPPLRTRDISSCRYVQK